MAEIKVPKWGLVETPCFDISCVVEFILLVFGAAGAFEVIVKFTQL